MELSFDISGERGAIAFTQERMNELHVWSGTPGRQGVTKIEAAPAHPPYDAFCPAPGHGLGFNDLKVMEVADLLTALGGGPAALPDFREAVAVQETVEAMQRSSADRACMTVDLP
jgi:predicted dehydrogenase